MNKVRSITWAGFVCFAIWLFIFPYVHPLISLGVAALGVVLAMISLITSEKKT